MALWFSLQDVGGGAGYGDHLGLIRKGGKRKRAYKAMRAVRNGKIRAARCGGASDRAAPRLAVKRPTEGAVLTDGENLPVRVTARDKVRKPNHELRTVPPPQVRTRRPLT